MKHFGNEVISVYHQSSKDHSKASVILNAYNKTEERRSKLSAKAFTSAIAQTTLNANESLLRLEIRYKRSAVAYRNTSIKSTMVAEEYIEVKTERDPHYDRFVEAIRYERQLREMNQLIRIYHLDKKITTKRNLKKAIRQQDKNDDYKDNVWKTVEYLNGLRKRELFKPDTTRGHIKFILNLGYHYIFTDIELPPLSLKHAQSRLPEDQKEAIRVSKIKEAASGYTGFSSTNVSSPGYIEDANTRCENDENPIVFSTLSHKEPSAIHGKLPTETKTFNFNKISSRCITDDDIGQIDSQISVNTPSSSDT